MGRHDSDPRERRHYVAAAAVVVLLVVLVVVGVTAYHALNG
ncbi:MAG: hypothetical protein ACLPN6_10990 [Streptosporangiaceae bacterium]|jgi:hypothetical protein